MLRPQAAEGLELGVRQADGVLEVDPRDDLEAGRRGERAVVREVVRARARDERGQGELPPQPELGVGRLDVRQVVHHLRVHRVVGRHHLVEEGEHDQAVAMQLRLLRRAILPFVEHHVQLHGVAVVVDEVLAAHRVVLAPVEVQLTEHVAAFERTARDHGGLRHVELEQDRVAVVGDGGRLGRRLEALVPDGWQVHPGHVMLVDVDGRLVLAPARLVVLAPVVRALVALVGEVIERLEHPTPDRDDGGGDE